MTTLMQDIEAFGVRLQEHGQRLNQANCILQRRVLEASLRKHPTAPAPAPTPEEREERYRAECARRGVQYVALPADQGADAR